MSMLKKSCSFNCQKWLLFSVCFVLIYFDLMMILFSVNIGQLYNDQASMYRSVMIESILSVLFCVVGVVGAYKENYCCTVLFSVFMTMLVVGEVYAAIMAPVFWLLVFFYICVTLIAFAFARQIRERMIAHFLEPQTSAYMRDNGRTYGLRFDTSYRFVNQRDNPFLQLRTVEMSGQQIPPYYPNNGQPSAVAFDRVPPPDYQELSPYPPSYLESERVAKHNNEQGDCVQHI